jgi:hypothetical protein
MYGNFVTVLSVTIISATRSDPDSRPHPKLSHNDTSTVSYAIFKLPLLLLVSVLPPTITGCGWMTECFSVNL